MSLIQALRQRKVPVGMQEAIALASALERGLHDCSLHQFKHVARAVLIHDECHLDDFEECFEFVFRGVIPQSKKLAEDWLDQLRQWLDNPAQRPPLTDQQIEELEKLDPEALRRLFEERLKEQTERHEGGSYWIGTGGTSPFGTGGQHPSGMSLRTGPAGSSAGGRSQVRSADPRRFRAYRNDVVLDVRQMEVALRKLRTFDRTGGDRELDLERTVDAIAKNFGELDLVFRKPRRPNTRVILLMDIGGSMDPYARRVSELFSAAKRATHWREFRPYYFHNCIYGSVYKTEGLRDRISVVDLMRECSSKYYLFIVGDASMAPYELMSGSDFLLPEERKSGLEWMVELRNHFSRSVWLNPDQSSGWAGSTVEILARVFPMFPLTLSGLTQAIEEVRTRASKN